MAREMVSYVAVTKFDVGIDDVSVETIIEGQEVKFDGIKAIIGDEEKNLPTLRAAVRAGWLQPDDENQTKHQPSVASIEIRGATPQQEKTVSDGSTRVAEEENVVHTVDKRNKFRDSSPEERRQQSQAPRPQGPRATKVVSDTQDGEDIGVRFKSAAQSSVDMSKVSRQDLNKMVNDLENKPSKAVEEPKAGKNRRESEGISFENHNVGERSAIGNEASLEDTKDSGNPFADGAQVVNRVGQKPEAPQRKVATEAVTNEESVGQRPQVTRHEAIDTDELEDDVDLETKEGKYRIAKVLHPELPEWDFSAHWRHKMDRLKSELSDNEIALRAIYVAESEAIRKRIKKEFGLEV